MSLAVLTDSTTAAASPLLNCLPVSGSSTKTMSVNSCWAWSVMPTVAVSPLTRTHSWDLVYFRSEGTLLINFVYFTSKRPGGKADFDEDSQFRSSKEHAGYFAFGLKSSQARFMLPSVRMWSVKTPTPLGNFTSAMLVMRFQ